MGLGGGGFGALRQPSERANIRNNGIGIDFILKILVVLAGLTLSYD